MKFLTCALFLIASVLTGCSEAGLHDKYEGAFLIGVAVGSEDIGHTYKFPMKRNADEWKLIHKEFNSLTAENLMKMQYMHPELDLYYFDDADEFIAPFKVVESCKVVIAKPPTGFFTF